jgi:sortase A
MLSQSKSRAPDGSANEVAARAAEAAVRAADAALVAANAAIVAANAAVRVVDEHDERVIVVEPARAPQVGDGGGPKVIHLPARADLATVPLATTHPAPSVRRRVFPARFLALVLITAGSLALADALTTLVWQEPFSALYTKLRQDHLSSALARVERTPPTSVEDKALAQIGERQRARIAYLAGALQQHSSEGSPVARIRIPRIRANFVVVAGTSTSDLRSGPGIFPETSFPGRGGTTAIAGHRTTYLAPFRHIDSLRAHDSIALEMPYAKFTYTVIGRRVVSPRDVHAAVANVGYPRLVLSACTPLFSAAKRLLVFARLERTVAKGAGLLPPAASSPPRTPGTPGFESALRRPV